MKDQFDGFFRISQIKLMYELTIMIGARVIRRKLNISELNTLGSDELPPLIRMKPKVSKLMININAMCSFF